MHALGMDTVQNMVLDAADQALHPKEEEEEEEKR